MQSKKSASVVCGDFACGFFVLAGAGTVILLAIATVAWVLEGVYSSNPANFHIWKPDLESVFMRAGCLIGVLLAVGCSMTVTGWLLKKLSPPTE